MKYLTVYNTRTDSDTNIHNINREKKISMYKLQYPLCVKCSKLSFYAPSGCTGFDTGRLGASLCILLIYIAMILGWENVRTSGAHIQKSCARPRKCARQVQGAPLITNTLLFKIVNKSSNNTHKHTPIHATIDTQNKLTWILLK